MFVKILKAKKHMWYSDKIGKVFEVKNIFKEFYVYNGKYAIIKEDCEKVDKSENSI